MTVIWRSPNSPTPFDVVALNKLINFFAGAVARGKELANDRFKVLEWRTLVVGVESNLVILGAKLGGVVEIFAIAEVIAGIRI